jgi:hypothetical protein
MKTLALALFLCLLFPAASRAQLGFSTGLGVNVSFPSADLNDLVATGIGGTALVKFGLIPLIDLTGGVEYVKFTGKDITVASVTGTGEGSALGFLVGGRFNLLPLLYGGLETGTYTFKKEFSAGGEDEITRGFFAPMIGANFGMFDANVRYVSASDDSFWSLRGMVWF